MLTKFVLLSQKRLFKEKFLGIFHPTNVWSIVSIWPIKILAHFSSWFVLAPIYNLFLKWFGLKKPIKPLFSLFLTFLGFGGFYRITYFAFFTTYFAFFHHINITYLRSKNHIKIRALIITYYQINHQMCVFFKYVGYK